MPIVSILPESSNLPQPVTCLRSQVDSRPTRIHAIGSTERITPQIDVHSIINFHNLVQEAENGNASSDTGLVGEIGGGRAGRATPLFFLCTCPCKFKKSR